MKAAKIFFGIIYGIVSIMCLSGGIRTGHYICFGGAAVGALISFLLLRSPKNKKKSKKSVRVNHMHNEPQEDYSDNKTDEYNNSEVQIPGTPFITRIQTLKERIMGLFGNVFGGGKKAQRIAALEAENAQLKEMLTPEQTEVCELLKEKERLCTEIESKNALISTLDSEISQKKQFVFDLDEAAIYQDFALYKPKYDFASSDDYKARLDLIRENQKNMIKNKTAVSGNTNWAVNNNKAQGKKMVTDMQKLLLRAFNNECDDAIRRVTYANFDLSVKRINSSAESISKLGSIVQIAITPMYLKSKLDELTLAFEYATKKQEEKEEQRELKAQMREEARLQKEIEEARKKIEKEQNHYQNALTKIESQIATAKTEEARADLEKKKADIISQLGVIGNSLKDIDYREANIKAGYVYIISNIGAFGENVFKIGMTRRLDPQDRIDELGDASVPFKFDVHALIFSDNAPALEAALHKTFEARKLNMVNHRKEFFNVSLDEIKEAVNKNFDKTVEFVDIPDAEQYRTSVKIKGLH